MAAGYASVRFVEAYGLWLERRWAEWFAAVSGGIYIPFEIYELLYGESLAVLRGTAGQYYCCWADDSGVIPQASTRVTLGAIHHLIRQQGREYETQNRGSPYKGPMEGRTIVGS
ncbi:MAG: DUF2127 domain-containing protein [Candidatus Methylomirabilis sp.]|nr:DUF2127 domain-containing protein [Candidatus Methylomirabilis sp.]